MFSTFLQQFKSDPRKFHQKFILALSGGADSMCMATLFIHIRDYLLKSENGIGTFDFALAHCNFHLRSEASDQDEALVRQWAAENQTALYVKEFNTPEILARAGGNLEATARELRYEWFDQLKKQLHFDTIVTAHHKEDSVETLLINFFKGTGMAGLHGILPFQNHIWRPLLPFTKNEIIAYNQAQHVNWREDATNKDDSYLRNYFRNQLIPATRQLLPSLVDNLYDNTRRFAEAERLYQKEVNRRKKQLITRKGKDTLLSVLRLQKSDACQTLIWEIVKDYGFSAGQVKDIRALLHSESGHYVSCSSYKIIRNRNFLIITAHVPAESSHFFPDWQHFLQTKQILIPTGKFTISGKILPAASCQPEKAATMAFLDAQKIEEPVIIRHPQEGEYFFPFGMNGKKKKISKFLTDLKIPIHEKEDTWVLESNKRIVWVIGYRIDQRFALTGTTRSVIKLKLIPEQS